MAALRLKELEDKLLALHQRGGEKNEYVGGFGGGHLHASSFEEVERHERERRELAAEVKEARAAAKQEREQLKQHAAGVNDASSWTKSLLDGESSKFQSADDGIERELTQATYGLVSAQAFRETKERLEKRRAEEAENAAADEARQAEDAARRREEKRQKRRKQQASKLSFEDEDEAGGG